MKNLLFCISPNSFIASNGKVRAIGDIHVKLDDYEFPDKDWFDFGSDILYWWMENFIKLFSKETDIVKCKFMDGNYRFDIKALNSQTWRVLFVAERSTDEIWQNDEISSQQATEALLSAARQMLEIVKKKGHEIEISNFSQRINDLHDLMQKQLANAN